MQFLRINRSKPCCSVHSMTHIDKNDFNASSWETTRFFSERLNKHNLFLRAKLVKIYVQQAVILTTEPLGLSLLPRKTNYTTKF